MDKVQSGQPVPSQSGDKELDHIILSDGTTKLVHLLSALNDCDEFSNFLTNLADINASVPYDSPFWPGCSVLHLAVIKGTKFWVELLEKSNSQRPVGSRTEEELEYLKRIDLCLTSGCSVMTKNADGITPIHLAFNENQLIAQLLLEKAPVLRESVSNSGLSHVHVAAYADDANAIEKLLQMGADIDRVFKVTGPELLHLTKYNNGTPLHVAILRGSGNAIYTLVKSGADISQQTPKKETPLQRLLFDYYYEPQDVKYYINSKLRELRRINEAIDVNGTTLLHAACAALDFEWVKELLEKGADANAQILKDSGKWFNITPMHLVIWSVFDCDDKQGKGADSLVKLLIEHGADPLVLCEGRESLLLLAYECYDFITTEDYAVFLLIADLLLKHQPTYRVNPMNKDGFSHFHYACMRNQVDIVKKFLDNGIDVNHMANMTLLVKELDMTQPLTNFTPLHFAAYYKSVEVARLLIERGANVNAGNRYEETPLHVAVREPHVNLNLFKILLSNVTEIDLTVDDYGLIGLAMKNAKQSDRDAIFEEIMKFHAMKNATKNYNLIQNIVDIEQKGELDVDFYITYIQRLIYMGCDIDQPNKKGETALHTANYQWNVEAIEALLLLGANINIVEVEGRPPINITYSGFEREGLIWKMLAAHVWKMKVAGLKVHNRCETCMLNVHEEFPLDENFVRQCKDEFDKLSKEDIGQSLTLKSFLHEWSGIIEYPTMPRIQREYVDQLFADSVNLRQSFPQFSGLLVMQYRKALDRLELHEAAMGLLPSVLQVDMPYLCLENILRYFDNDELKYFVEGHQEVVSVDAQMQTLSV